MSDWNADQYLKFKKQRTQPSIDLAAMIPVDSPKNVIDIGCGPGNSTRVLKNKFPDAHVTGADFSPNMIEKAKAENPDVDFMLFDASNDFPKLTEKYDVVFSNACIQWVPEHQKLLKNMMSVLNDGGVLAVQIPVNTKEPVHRIIREVSSREKWADRLGNSRIFYTLSESEYYDVLSEISSSFDMRLITYFHSMPSHMSIIEWYRSTGLKPYLDRLNDAEKNEFEQDILAELENEYPKQKNGDIIFRFPRLFFTAVK